MADTAEMLTEVLARYDEMVLEGRPPDPEAFCEAHPDLPDLRERIEQLDRLRGDLDRLLRDAPPEMAPPPDTFAGFAVHREIGRGGMGVVYLAEQQAPRRLCSLKLINPSMPAALDRFRREADLAARLQHPGIAAVYAFGVEDGQPYLATEFVHGFPLRDLLQAADVIAPDAATDWFVDAMRRLSEGLLAPSTPYAKAPVKPMVNLATQIADALAHAHQRGVIHRDVKPSNIIVGLDGRARLIDFGIAMTNEDEASRLTRTGTFIGSHEYAAPEQLRGEHANIGPWTDTYALGATLFEMLTQRTPFECVTFADRLAVASETPPFGPRYYNRKVSSQLDDLVMRAMSPEPAYRFHDGEELVEALRACPVEPPLFPALPRGALTRALPTSVVGWLALAGIGVSLGLGFMLTEAHDALDRERASFRAQEMLYARELLGRELQSNKPALEACLLKDQRPTEPTRAPRFIADIKAHRGRITDVQVSPESYNVSGATRQCMAEVVQAFVLPGVGMREPTLVQVDLSVSLESLTQQ